MYDYFKIIFQSQYPFDPQIIKNVYDSMDISRTSTSFWALILPLNCSTIVNSLFLMLRTAIAVTLSTFSKS